MSELTDRLLVGYFVQMVCASKSAAGAFVPSECISSRIKALICRSEGKAESVGALLDHTFTSFESRALIESGFVEVPYLNLRHWLSILIDLVFTHSRLGIKRLVPQVYTTHFGRVKHLRCGSERLQVLLAEANLPLCN